MVRPDEGTIERGGGGMDGYVQTSPLSPTVTV